MDPLQQFGAETEPDAATLQRVRRRVDRKMTTPAQAPWLLVGTGALVALGVLFLLRPQAPQEIPGLTPVSPPVVATAQEVPLVPATLDTSQKSLTTPDGKVQLSWEGSGRLSGTARVPRIEWDGGTIAVEVTPNQGIDLAVQTREATIRVVGTGFRVTRDVLGTEVQVLHGKVAVECADGSSVLIGQDQSRVCPPISGFGLLGRARALKAAHRPATEILATVEMGLASKDITDSVRDELEVLQVEALEEADRKAEAAKAAEAYLAKPNPQRVVEMHRYAANLTGEANCGLTVQHLKYAIEKQPLTQDLLLYAQCLRTTDRKEARAALDRALKLADTTEDRAAIQASLDALGKAD